MVVPTAVEKSRITQPRHCGVTIATTIARSITVAVVVVNNHVAMAVGNHVAVVAEQVFSHPLLMLVAVDVVVEMDIAWAENFAACSPD